MNFKLISLAAGLAIFSAWGCGNTAEGMKQDTERNAQDAEHVSKDAMNNAQEAGRDLSAAAALTPAIQAAILQDSVLNDSKNSINADSSEEKVVLKGHVMTEAMKKAAGELAMRIIKEKNGKQSVDNQLMIQP